MCMAAASELSYPEYVEAVQRDLVLTRSGDHRNDKPPRIYLAHMMCDYSCSLEAVRF